METRQQWGTRAGFIFAAVGSAVGLGKHMAFSFIQRMKMEEAHSFTVLIRIINDWYFIVSIQFACSGHRHRGSAPLTFFRIHPRAEFIGWWQMCVTFIVSTYYAVIIAWSISYTYFAITGAWGKTRNHFI